MKLPEHDERSGFGGADWFVTDYTDHACRHCGAGGFVAAIIHLGDETWSASAATREAIEVVARTGQSLNRDTIRGLLDADCVKLDA